ncbi:hypothetical protein [Streptomyces sp. NPDC046909]|uniref:hypothetical protein n=1 Tax=Streptomyces sp. NPDC046909 TaxID=3155617 RepID=UPI0033DD71B6
MDSLVLALDMELPVPLEVAVGEHGTPEEDGLAAGQAPVGAGDVEAALSGL